MEHMSNEEFLNLKPGDYVRVRSLADMQNDKDAIEIKRDFIYFKGNSCGFNILGMSRYCGKEVKVTGNVFDGRISALGDDGGRDGWWCYTKHMLEPLYSVPEVINIDVRLFDDLLL